MKIGRKISFGGGGFKPFTDKGKAKQTDASTKETKPDVGCFICGRPHYAGECPKMEKLNALLANDNEHEETVVIFQFLTLYFLNNF